MCSWEITEMHGIDQRTLLIAVRIPPFTKRAKRRVAMHPKFFFFDADVPAPFGRRVPSIHPRKPKDRPSRRWSWPTCEPGTTTAPEAVRVCYWRTSQGDEVYLSQTDKTFLRNTS